MIRGDSSTAEQPTLQLEDGGATPTSPLQVSKCRIYTATRSEVRDFVERWHYSGSINGLQSDYCFRLCAPNGDMIGAAIFGGLAMHRQWQRFGQTKSDVIELRRLCCVDATPKNIESFFIGYMLRWMTKNTCHKVVVSYADAEYGHQGTIYKASNFKLLDFRKGAPVILWNGKRYHDKAIRTKYKGVLKPFAKSLIEALENGEASYVPTKGKFTFVYDLEEHRKAGLS